MLWRRGLITGISIHAPREGGDESSADCCKTVFSDFNPRPPRGGRLAHCASGPRWPYFNPRPPRGGRLLPWAWCTCTSAFQSTPPARGATLFVTVHNHLHQVISIHAPREGGDKQHTQEQHTSNNFNPRPPRGGRPAHIRDLATQRDISIHAPREGGDSANLSSLSIIFDFNPRPPRGGRPLPSITAAWSAKFQSTPPARGATRSFFSAVVSTLGISIHAPREGGDRAAAMSPSYTRAISIHAPREGGDP